MRQHTIRTTGFGTILLCGMAALLGGCISLEYDNVVQSGTVEAYEQFADRYPASSLGAQSRSAAEALQALQDALDSEYVTVKLHWSNRAAGSAASVVMVAHVSDDKSPDDTSCTVAADFDLVEAGAVRAAGLLVELCKKADLSALPDTSTVTVQLWHGVKPGPHAPHGYARPVFARCVTLNKLPAADATTEQIKTVWQAPAYYENRIDVCASGDEAELVLNVPLRHPPGPGMGYGPGPGPVHGGPGFHIGVGIPLH